MKRRDLLKLIGISPIVPALVKATESKPIIKKAEEKKGLLIDATEIAHFITKNGFFINKYSILIGLGPNIIASFNFIKPKHISIGNLIEDEDLIIENITIPVQYLGIKNHDELITNGFYTVARTEPKYVNYEMELLLNRAYKT